MKEYRCKKCHKLLLKHDSKFGSVEVQVKCPKCGAINTVCISQIIRSGADKEVAPFEFVH